MVLEKTELLNTYGGSFFYVTRYVFRHMKFVKYCIWEYLDNRKRGR